MSAYQLADAPSPEITRALSHLDGLTQKLLVARGIVSVEEVEKFLHPSYEDHLHDPSLLHDMEKAVVRILRALEKNERIAIFSDYDCDGIPGGVVLYDFFTEIGYTNFQNYIPHRHYEGFGLSVSAVEKLHADGVTLIITIDCGTGDVDAVHIAKQLGIDVIVTDHHEPKEKLPDALAIVNPKVGNTYPFDGICGTGVVFKLVQTLITKGGELHQFQLKTGWEKWWLDMVGIATIADMVPLIDENRIFARYGLEVLKKSRRPGLQQLLRKQRVEQRYLTEDDIGFTIGPRINAASRMDTPEDAFCMLASRNDTEAASRVEHLEKLNRERKTAVGVMTKEIHKRLKLMIDVPPVLVLGDPEWRPALVGLAANKLAEEHKRPVFLWGRDGNGTIKGSCRSDGKTSLIRLMEGAREHFVEFGGHHFSGGFTIHEETVHELPAAINTVYALYKDEAFITEVTRVDHSLLLDEVNDTLLRTLRNLAPYGVGNPKPLFSFEKVVPRDVQQFGKAKEHLKITFDTKGLAREAIAFFATSDDFGRAPNVGEELTLLAHVEESYFMNRLQVRLRIVDIV